MKNTWVIVPFVAALAGTVVMLFTNSANILKLSLILALWAAVAGLIVIYRLRRDNEEATRLQEEREKTFAAELEAARAGAPSGVDAPSEELLHDIQEELRSLRSTIEEMSGHVFEYEPAAVHAAARRIQEIESFTQPTYEPSDDRPAGAPSSDAIAGRIGSQPSRETQNPLTALISEHQAKQEAKQPEPEPAPEPEPVPEPEPEPEPAPEPEAEHGRHEQPTEVIQAVETPPEPEPRAGGRRRRDAAGQNAVSVAELLARRNK
ncbi:hypothetical protein BJP08_06215 [Corynebacterium sp. NML140438]|uniref:DUF6779 domain-containing protein n=1 Tax=Corynebacterium sp. NML140438 TaxID=1906334 RepID=UPI000911C7CC|nr:DUF6779 domain-containing protein [Corynebacterium sp. NML140438]OIR41845.1 hypothetical protein BJP08_06215 [Corynebacterium sp. NML140438]